MSDVEIRDIHPEAFVDINSTLMYLQLDNNLLERVPYESLVYLEELQSLDLYGNRITHLERAGFQNLKKLDTLLLSKNALFTIISGAFEGLVSLANLALSENPLSKVGFLTDLHGVEKVYLHRCLIQTISSPLFQMKSDNQLMYISHNGLTALHPLAFSYMNESTILKLNNNLLTEDDICGVVWAPLTKLQVLDLGNNALLSISSYCFKYLASVTTLSLDHNNISVVENNAFVGLENIKTLELSFNDLQVLLNGSFNGLHALTELDLQNNNIRLISSECFTSMIKLRSLKLQNNNLTTLSSTVFPSALTSPYSISLDGNPLMCTCVMQWVQNTPFSLSSRSFCTSNDSNKPIKLIRFLFDQCSETTSPTSLSSGGKLSSGSHQVVIILASILPLLYFAL